MPFLLLWLAWFGHYSAVLAPALPAAAPVFSDADRTSVVAFWNAPGRAQVRLAPARVALTPEASVWRFGFNRASRTTPPPADLALWKMWVSVKFARDRWEAGQAVGAPDTGPAPPAPGVIPASLLSACGDPPLLAAPVVPWQWTINLESGGEPLTYTDHVAVSPTSPYFRSEAGVMSGGVPLRLVPPADMDALFTAAGLTPFERHVMQGVSPLEGGFDAVNTYDTGYVSVGFIQFITGREGRGSLASVLAQEKAAHPEDFARDFHRRGIDVAGDGGYVVVDPATGAELTGADAVSRTVADPRLVAVFQDAGRRSVAFRAAQVVVAKRAYYPADDALTVTLPDGSLLRGKVSDAIRSEAGMATLFDRKVNTGTVTPALPAAVSKVLAEHGVKTWEALAPFEREVVSAVTYRADFLNDPRLTQPRALPTP